MAKASIIQSSCVSRASTMPLIGKTTTKSSMSSTVSGREIRASALGPPCGSNWGDRGDSLSDAQHKTQVAIGWIT